MHCLVNKVTHLLNHAAMLYHIILAPPTLSHYIQHVTCLICTPFVCRSGSFRLCNLTNSRNYHAANPAAPSITHICDYAKLSCSCHAANWTIEVTFWRQHCHSCITSPIIHSHHLNVLQHLPNVETCFYCPQAFLTV